MQFVLGSTVDTSRFRYGDIYYVEVPTVLSVEISGFRGAWGENYWRIVGNDRGEVAQWNGWAESALATTTTYPHLVTNYDNSYGGNTLFSWDIVAASGDDPASRIGFWLTAWVTVFDEDGTDMAGNRPDADIVTKGRWQNSSCDCWLGGTVLRTRQRKARMTYTAEVLEGEIIAIVMPMAPNRGQARIKLDGVNQGRIDTYAETRDNRIVMWQTPPLEAGVHTVQIINLATAGRPRIDVDAFLTETGGVHD